MNHKTKEVVRGMALALVGIFLLAQTGLAASTLPGLDPNDPLIGKGAGSNFDPGKQNQTITGEGSGQTVAGEPTTPPVIQPDPPREPTPNELVVIVTRVFAKLAVVANSLVVVMNTTLQTITDMLTGDVTETKSVTNTKYDSLGRATSQTGFSESETTSTNGTTSKSKTILTFLLNAATGGFVVTNQVTNTTTVDPGKITEDQVDGNGRRILDKRKDDTTTRQRSVITREYNDKGFLTDVEGHILNGRTTANGGKNLTTFFGDLLFDINLGTNSETLKKQTTTSLNVDRLRNETTTTTSVLNQSSDAFGRIQSGSAVADSKTVSNDRKINPEERYSESKTTTNFVVSDLNNLVAFLTLTSGLSVDATPAGATQGVGRSTQQVIIENEGVEVVTETLEDGTERIVDVRITGSVTGRVFDGRGHLSSQTANVDTDWSGDFSELEGVGEIQDEDGDGDIDRDDTRIAIGRYFAQDDDVVTVRANTEGTLDFDVIQNQILNTKSTIDIRQTDVANNSLTIQHQVVDQRYDANARGTDGTITTSSLTGAKGAIDEGTTGWNPLTGRWDVEYQRDAAGNPLLTDQSVRSETLTQIHTEFIAGEFRATDILSVTKTNQFQNPNAAGNVDENGNPTDPAQWESDSWSQASTNVTYTHQEFGVDGVLKRPTLSTPHQGSRIEFVEALSSGAREGSSTRDFINTDLTVEALMNHYSDGTGRIRTELIDPDTGMIRARAHIDDPLRRP